MTACHATTCPAGRSRSRRVSRDQDRDAPALQAAPAHSAQQRETQIPAPENAPPAELLELGSRIPKPSRIPEPSQDLQLASPDDVSEGQLRLESRTAPAAWHPQDTASLLATAAHTGIRARLCRKATESRSQWLVWTMQGVHLQSSPACLMHAHKL